MHVSVAYVGIECVRQFMNIIGCIDNIFFKCFLMYFGLLLGNRDKSIGIQIMH